MSVIRNRAINNFPMVLLTLLSIVQALAFELLWEEVHIHRELYQLNWVAVFGWIQIVTTLLGIILIWISYATSVMRFRWLPSTLDSLFPFLVGIVQFVMVDNLGQERIVVWIFALGVLFALMNWIAHFDMKRARQNEENAEFFRLRGRATIRDFLPTIAIVIGLCALSLILWLMNSNVWMAGFAVLIAFYLIVQQLFIADGFWRWSMALDDEANNNSGIEINSRDE